MAYSNCVTLIIEKRIVNSGAYTQSNRDYKWPNVIVSQINGAVNNSTCTKSNKEYMWPNRPNHIMNVSSLLCSRSVDDGWRGESGDWDIDKWTVAECGSGERPVPPPPLSLPGNQSQSSSTGHYITLLA